MAMAVLQMRQYLLLKLEMIVLIARLYKLNLGNKEYPLHLQLY